MKDVILSGIRPTGKLHIGNYFGALKNFVELQNQYECYFFIADLHSLNEQFDPKIKRQQTIDLAKDFLAAGLDPKKCTIFVQSQMPSTANWPLFYLMLSSVIFISHDSVQRQIRRPQRR
jgi:tryptophanyl-tRNA synthetase